MDAHEPHEDHDTCSDRERGDVRDYIITARTKSVVSWLSDGSVFPQPVHCIADRLGIFFSPAAVIACARFVGILSWQICLSLLVCVLYRETAHGAAVSAIPDSLSQQFGFQLSHKSSYPVTGDRFCDGGLAKALNHRSRRLGAGLPITVDPSRTALRFSTKGGPFLEISCVHYCEEKVTRYKAVKTSFGSSSIPRGMSCRTIWG